MAKTDTEFAGLPTEVLNEIHEAFYQDIVERYNNEEYWNYEIAKAIAWDRGYNLTDI